jgi:hypothetical protein
LLDQSSGLGTGRSEREVGEGGDTDPMHPFQLRAGVNTRQEMIDGTVMALTGAS